MQYTPKKCTPLKFVLNTYMGVDPPPSMKQIVWLCVTLSPVQTFIKHNSLIEKYSYGNNFFSTEIKIDLRVLTGFLN